MVSTWANSSTDPPSVLSPARGLADILGNARRSCRFKHRGPLDRPHDRARQGARESYFGGARRPNSRFAAAPPTAARYAATVAVQRPRHLLMPGMVNAATTPRSRCFAALPQTRRRLSSAVRRPGVRAGRGSRDGRRNAASRASPASAIDTIFPTRPRAVACEQGMRAVIGLPVGRDTESLGTVPGRVLDAGLRVRDEYKGHPLISTAFAPHAARRQ